MYGMRVCISCSQENADSITDLIVDSGKPEPLPDVDIYDADNSDWNLSTNGRPIRLCCGTSESIYKEVTYSWLEILEQNEINLEKNKNYLDTSPFDKVGE